MTAQHAYPPPRLPLFASSDGTLAERVDEELARGFGGRTVTTPQPAPATPSGVNPRCRPSPGRGVTERDAFKRTR
jgi:hypothetical protein